MKGSEGRERKYPAQDQRTVGRRMKIERGRETSLGNFLSRHLIDTTTDNALANSSITHRIRKHSLQILRRRLPIARPGAISLDGLLRGALIRLEEFDLGGIHILHHVIGLPLLEAEAEAFVRVVFVIGLVLMVLDLDEVGVLGGGVEGKGDEGVDGSGFGDDFEGPRLHRIDQYGDLA